MSAAELVQSDAEEIADHFLSALDAAAARTRPFRHWLLDGALPLDAAQGIADLPFAPPVIGDTEGRRETHNSTRRFFSAENRRAFAVCDDVAAVFQSKAVAGRLKAETGANLCGSYPAHRVLPGYGWLLAGAAHRYRRQAVHDADLSVGSRRGRRLGHRHL